MIVMYRLPGLIAVVALFIYALLALAIFKFIPVTLTLAGVAGFIMSIGMAVATRPRTRRCGRTMVTSCWTR
jgi:preprotein translocase subunit SecD